MHRNVLLAALGSFVHIISVNGLECVGERCVSMHNIGPWVSWMTISTMGWHIWLARIDCFGLFWCLPPLMCSLSYGRSDRKSGRSGIKKPTNPLLKHEIPVPTEDYCQNGGTRLCQGWSQVRQQWLGCSRRRKALRELKDTWKPATKLKAFEIFVLICSLQANPPVVLLVSRFKWYG